MYCILFFIDGQNIFNICKNHGETIKIMKSFLEIRLKILKDFFRYFYKKLYNKHEYL